MNNGTCADLLKARTIITLVFSLTFCILCIIAKPIPQTLDWIVKAFIGFWFGEKILKYIIEKNSTPK